MSTDQTVRDYLEEKIERGEFIRRLRAVGVTAGAAFGFADVLAGYRAALAAGESGPPGGHAALTPAEFDLVEAIAERILPTTDTPGAREAGCANYIDIALAGAYRALLARYRSGLAALARRNFAMLSAPDQDAVLADLESGKLVDVEGSAAFFALVRKHVMEGFFCEPQYGGNHNMVGWKLVGFPGAQYGYADPYINRVVNIPPVATLHRPGAAI